MNVQDLPTLRVEDIQAMPEDEWEALCERISQGDTCYLVTQEGQSRDAVFVPYHLYEWMVRAAGGEMPNREADAADAEDRFAKVFASLRGSLKDHPDLDIGP